MISSFIVLGSTKLEEVVTKALTEAGITLATKISEAEGVFVYCESQTDLEDLFFDTDGLVQSAQKGAYLINLSSSTPSFARELHAIATVSELHSIEAPFAVRDCMAPKALSYDNTFAFVAGEEDDVAVAIPLLKKLFSTIHETGKPGSAQIARAAYTLQNSAQEVAYIEAEALCKAFSSPSDDTLSFLMDEGLMTSRMFDLIKAGKDERFEGDYTIAMWMSELTAALMTADDIELILPGAEACMHLLELLAIIGGSEMAPSALSLVYGEESLCAKHNLDWTKAEQTFSSELDGYPDDDFDTPDTYPGDFGSYSSN